MNPKRLFYLLLIVVGCAKSNNSGPVDDTPTNLTLTANVSTDNSGNVSFTAAATNAVTYEFGFGNGIFQTVPSGMVTYRYPASGTYSVTVTARSAGGKTATKTIQVTVNVTLALVWSDEFDTPGAPNSAKWGYEIGTGVGGWGNNELQYYTNRPENAVVQNGVLKITAIRESFSGSAFTSARLITKDKFSFKYGKIEARAKLPVGIGTWPAIWMLGNNISTAGWPACGEIDIMEHRGSELNKIFGTFHYPGRSGGNADGNTTIISNASTEFHKYTVEWNASIIKIYADDVLYHTLANTSALPFNQNFFVIVNLAMGGTFGGAVDSNFTNASLEIDYIRIYQ